MLSCWLPALCLKGATLWADGAWSAAVSGTLFSNNFCADGQPRPKMAKAGAKDIGRAAQVARTGAAAW
ncbi:hypothetical protein EBE87_24950 [Pseudoroseomonas wenyumeiae]|uniref:Secreted protein n=2 Tax=Teichococcus wenyumeiae TaxID=2478470 RepID=A0A3A9JA87_9PROT|nr:hypothetical protein D6Z83_15025 [Pseudoroseomonas wenyumeiae]RMI16888.1 hypothetical protein EBE87_24950 [Pseudoroseomonas wenyumeiae]